MAEIDGAPNRRLPSSKRKNKLSLLSKVARIILCILRQTQSDTLQELFSLEELFSRRNKLSAQNIRLLAS